MITTKRMTPDRLKTNVWWCKKLTSTTWDKPKLIRLPLVATNSDSEIQVYGKSYTEYYKIKDTGSTAESIKIGDRMYINKIVPLVHNALQNNKETDSNYEVDTPPTYTMGITDIRIKYRDGY